jgi:hypothetical protein
MNRMKVSERFALEHWLSDYPDNFSYANILKKLDCEDVTVWEMLDGYVTHEIAKIIDDTRKQFESSADDLCSGIKLSDVMEGACDD